MPRRLDSLILLTTMRSPLVQVAPTLAPTVENGNGRIRFSFGRQSGVTLCDLSLAKFGTKRSQVQILSPRLLAPYTFTTFGDDFWGLFLVLLFGCTFFWPS